MAGYTGLTLPEVGRLNWVQYLTYRRDAFLYQLEGSEEGQEYLNNAWRLEQVKPDRAALRRRLKKGDEADGS